MLPFLITARTVQLDCGCLVVLCCVSSRSDHVISWAAERLPESLFVLYEQIRPHDPFGQIMQGHFLKLNSSIHSLQQYPDTAAQRRRFLDKASMQTIHTEDTCVSKQT